MLNIFAVFIGGGIGAAVRYIVGIVFLHTLKTNLPAATFCVNIIGCIILGFLYVYFIEKTQIPSAVKFALTAGFCGGLTTFSTFSLEIFEMLQNNQFITVFLYILFSVIIGVIGIFLGGYCAKLL